MGLSLKEENNIDEAVSKLSAQLLNEDYRSLDTYNIAELVVENPRIVLHLIEGGYYRKAVTLVDEASSKIYDLQRAQELALYGTLARFMTTGDLHSCLRIARKCLDTAASLELKALAFETNAKLTIFGITFNILPEERLSEARSFLDRAIALYDHLQLHERKRLALSKISDYAQLGTLPQYQVAKFILTALGKESSQENASFAHETRGKLLELTFKVDTASWSTATCRSEFQKLLIESDPYAISNAHANLACARTLQARGFDAGPEAQAALQIFKKYDHLSGVYQSLSLLGNIHFQLGRIAFAGDCFKEAISVADTMGFLLGTTFSKVGLLQYHATMHMAESVSEQLQTLENAIQIPIVSSAIGITIANFLFSLKRYDKALQACHTVERVLSKAKNTFILSQSLFLKSLIQQELRNWKEARQALLKAANLDKKNSNWQGQVQKLQAIAQIVAMEDYEKTKSLSVASQKTASSYINRCKALIMGNCGSTDLILGNLYQQEAQLFITMKSFVPALKLLSKARACYEQGSLRFETATTDTLLGLLYHEIAGTNGTHQFYKEAYAAFDRAKKYFDTLGLHANRWKVRTYEATSLFHYALSLKDETIKKMPLHQALASLDEAWQLLELSMARTPTLSGADATTSLIETPADGRMILELALNISTSHLNNEDISELWMSREKKGALSTPSSQLH